MAQLLTTVDADEVSPVRRGANRKRVVLKAEGEVQVGSEIADITSVPWENEGAMIDAIRKDGGDETVVEAAVGAMRLLNGIANELPDGLREAVEKLGSEIYTRTNAPLNTVSVSSPGDLTGSSYGSAKDGSSPKTTDLSGSGKTGELAGSGSGSKVAAGTDDDMDDDGVMKDGKAPYGDVTYADPGYQSDGVKRYPLDSEAHIRAAWSYINMPKNAAKYEAGQVSAIKGRIKSAMKSVGADVAKDDPIAKAFQILKAAMTGKQPAATEEDPDGEDEVEEPDGTTEDNDDTVEKGGTVDTHAVPVQKEDGSWDLSAVPEETRSFYTAMIEKADETAVKLEKAETELAETRETLRTNEIIAKAEDQFKTVGERDTIVEVLKEASAKLSPEAYEKLESVLSAANEQIEKGDLFKELGTTALGGTTSDSWAKIEKAADDLVEKADTGMTRAEAIDRVLKTQPELYDAYMRENGLAVS